MAAALAGFLKLGKGRLNVFEEGFKQAFFQCQCLLLRGQDFVFEGFEFGGDEAFGVFQGLAGVGSRWALVQLGLWIARCRSRGRG